MSCLVMSWPYDTPQDHTSYRYTPSQCIIFSCLVLSCLTSPNGTAHRRSRSHTAGRILIIEEGSFKPRRILISWGDLKSKRILARGDRCPSMYASLYVQGRLCKAGCVYLIASPVWPARVRSLVGCSLLP